MNWDAPHHDPRVELIYGSYKTYVLSVATHYAGSRLLEHFDISSLDKDTCLAISNNFPEGLTTIRTVGELRDSIATGEYGQLCLRLAVVNLCTAFEVLFDSISAIYSISVKAPADGVSATYHRVSASPEILGNKTIMQIRKLHTKHSFWSVLNADEALMKLNAIIEARNCIVHSAAQIQDEKLIRRLKAYAIYHSIGETLHLPDNLLDDFLHYMGIHVVGFIKKLPAIT